MLSLTLRNLLPSRIRLFPSREHDTDYQDLGHPSGSLETEYQRLVAHHLARWGIPAGHVSVDVQPAGTDGGKVAFHVVISLVHWDRTSVLRVLIGLPLLEKKVRKAMTGMWIADVSALRAILVRASESIQQTDACTELRQTLVNLTGGRSHDKAGRASRIDLTLSP